MQLNAINLKVREKTGERVREREGAKEMETERDRISILPSSSSAVIHQLRGFSPIYGVSCVRRENYETMKN